MNKKRLPATHFSNAKRIRHIFLFSTVNLMPQQRGGRSLGRHDDGLQKAANGFADQNRDDEVLERLEKPVGTAKRCFRGKVVGSNPAGPTKSNLCTSFGEILPKQLYCPASGVKTLIK